MRVTIRVPLLVIVALTGGGVWQDDHHRHHHLLMVSALAPVVAVTRSVRYFSSSSSSAMSSSSVTDFLQELLLSLANNNNNAAGQRLLEASSESWRLAIFSAVGAKLSAEQGLVAQALQDAMSKTDSQFAILLGKAEPYVATFPSDVVDYRTTNDGTAWVECQLRHRETDALLVTMGISVVLQSQSPVLDGTDDTTGTNQWLISSLDWQDFREQFYPGLSGREWLRSF